MTFDELASGGVSLLGCSNVTHLQPRPTYVGRFVAGDTLYNVAKARRGVLEKVVIKGVRMIASRRTFGSNRVLYTDTFNGLWNEYDLVPYEDAVELILRWADALEADKNRLAC